MLINILIAIAVLVALVLIIASTRPSDFRVTRHAPIAAPAAAVFAQVNDLRKWDAWSPWAKLDPNAKQTFSGPGAGTGASFAWAGNSKIGEGRMTITESRPFELVRFRLEFLKPFAATNTAEFTFRADGRQTVVTWSMFGKSNFMSKVMGLFINCEDMVGKQFEQGLANMRAVCEASAEPATKAASV